MAGPQLPKALILGVYGAFGRQLGGWLAISHLIELLGEFGIDEQAVRSSTSRLKRRGMLERERRRPVVGSSGVGEPASGDRSGRSLGGDTPGTRCSAHPTIFPTGPASGGTAAGYSLTPLALEVLAEGDRRIYSSRGPADSSEGWVLVIFSIPESRRDQRHQLRSRLVWLGFGNLSSGVWIAPARLRPDAEATLSRLGLTSYVDVFEARYTGFGAVEALVSRAWDLPALAKQYAEFLDAQRPVLHAWERDASDAHTGAGDVSERDRQAFVDYLTALTQWRRLPFLDPGLPVEVLPDDWPGHAASDVFHSLRDLIEPRAAAWVHSVVSAL